MKNKGFTLIEVLIVIAIIGILLGIAAISGKDWIVRYRVESQTKKIYTDLMNARVRAMAKNRTCFFVLSSAAPTSYAVYEDTDPAPDGDEIQTAADTQVMQVNIEYPVTWTNSGNTTIAFDSKGIANVPGTLHTTASYGTSYDCIKISYSTRIKMGTWNPSASNCTTK